MKRKKLIAGIFAMFLLCLIPVSGTFAYLTATAEGGPVVNTFVASKALINDDGAFLIEEHQAVKQSDGSYTLNETSVVQANTYELKPGVDVPKDPYVTLTGKNEVPAYLYLKVYDGLNENVDWYIDSTNWRYTLKSGDYKVYVYAPDLYNPEPLTFDVSNVNIIQDKTILVEAVDDLGIAEEGMTLSFEAYLGQVSAGTTAKEVFTNCFESN